MRNARSTGHEMKTKRHASVPVVRRTLHVIDIENEVGGPNASVDDVRRWFAVYRSQIVVIQPGDQVIVGASHRAAKTVWFALLGENIQRRVRSGPDGGELSITDGLDLAHLSRAGFSRVMLCSADGGLVHLALEARAVGMQVHQVIGLGKPSRVLSAVVHTRTVIRPSALRAVTVHLRHDLADRAA